MEMFASAVFHVTLFGTIPQGRFKILAISWPNAIPVKREPCQCGTLHYCRECGGVRFMSVCPSLSLSLFVTENTGKLLLRDLVTLTIGIFCNSQCGALMNRFPVMMLCLELPCLVQEYSRSALHTCSM